MTCAAHLNAPDTCKRCAGLLKSDRSLCAVSSDLGFTPCHKGRGLCAGAGEGSVASDAEALALREELRSAFVNITRIMDCVGCEKCKLWGKLQTLGALRTQGSKALARHRLSSASGIRACLATAAVTAHWRLTLGLAQHAMLCDQVWPSRVEHASAASAGVATALKVLFSSSDCSGSVPTQPALSTLVLERNEVRTGACG
jgi:hypothetical protein